jgi:hypothetical protein
LLVAGLNRPARRDDGEGMRGLALIFVCLLTSGCFVFEELDKGMAIMEAHTPKATKEKQEAEAKAKLAEGEKPPTYAEKVGGWFENAKSLAPREHTSSGDPMVNCNAQGRTFFTKRSDCLARGGRPG